MGRRYRLRASDVPEAAFWSFLEIRPDGEPRDLAASLLDSALDRLPLGLPSVARDGHHVGRCVDVGYVIERSQGLSKVLKGRALLPAGLSM